LTRDLYVPPRSQCRNTLTTSSFFFFMRNEVSAHPLGPVKAFRSAIAAVRLAYTGNKQVVILLLLLYWLCLCLCLLCMWWHLGRS
jgi:hypothetical protein